MLDGDTLKFGDEIEYMVLETVPLQHSRLTLCTAAQIVKYDTVNRQPLLVLRGAAHNNELPTFTYSYLWCLQRMRCSQS